MASAVSTTWPCRKMPSGTESEDSSMQVYCCYTGRNGTYNSVLSPSHSTMTAPTYDHLTAPATGSRITMVSGKLRVPDQPIIPFIEGDGTGPDIWAASRRVLDAAVDKAYKGEKRIAWYEVFAGEKAFNKYNNWLP